MSNNQSQLSNLREPMNKMKLRCNEDTLSNMARVSQCVISWREIEANINQRHLAALGGETLTRTEQIYSGVSVCQ